jgi:60 kDa SS-A/Ro ribonucleoprotein
MPDALSAINLRQTAQTEQADPRQVQNNAGGYTFTVDLLTRLRRFLVLGTDGGTYYVSEKALTKENAQIVLDWARNDCTKLVDELISISVAGRAPRQNPTLFALAAAASLGDLKGRKAAFAAIPAIVRTGTHMFLFVKYVEQFRGWGQGLKHAVARWYTTKPVDDVAYQVVKYRQREGWSQRDLLRLSHPKTDESTRAGLFDWICGREDNFPVPDLIYGFQAAQKATTKFGWLYALEHWPSLSWEMLPDAALKEPAVWEALLHNGMPQTALMRQLPRLTKLGLLTPMSSTLAQVTAQLTNAEKIRKARLHPVNVLIAGRTYGSGVSARGSGTWQPSAKVVDALDDAFYLAFGAIEPSNKRTLLALDVSGSMSYTPIADMPLTPREASAALALVTAATEPNYAMMAFSGGFIPLNISPKQRLNDAIHAVSVLPFDRTDCSLPMLWALQNKILVDTFIIYTDSETWFGRIHPHQALREYRERSGIDARLAVVGMTSTNFTIADPADPGSMDVAGFDAAVPKLLTDFSARAI